MKGTLQSIQAIIETVPPTRMQRHAAQIWRVQQRQPIIEVGNGIVVGVHLLTSIPVLPAGGVAILLHPAIPKMILSPPAGESMAISSYAPSLSLQSRTGSTDSTYHDELT